jgi:integrase
MAWIETRNLADGTQTYRVIWRDDAEKRRSPAMDTKAEAQQYIAIMKGNAAQGIRFDPARPRTPFGVYTTSWVATRPVGKNVEATRRKELAYLGRILPRWQAVPIGAIENSHVRMWINELVEPADEDDRPLAASTIRSIYALFCQIMRQAEIDRFLPMGCPVGKRAVPLPPMGIDRRQFLTKDELEHLLAVCRTYFPAWYPFVYVAAHTGMRNGELLALDRASYNSIGRYLRISRAVKRANGGPHIGAPKNGRTRRVDLDADLKAVLDAHLAGHDHELIFPNEIGDVVHATNWRKRVWVPLREQAGFPLLHFHDLRHTHITHQLSAGIPVIVVSERAGHASSKMTQDLYGHAIPGQQQTALLQYRAWAG